MRVAGGHAVLVRRRRPLGDPAPLGAISGPVGSVSLPVAHLVAELHRQSGVEFLHVQSSVDPAQDFLLPVAHRPAVAGLSGFTAVGRVHAVYWALVYGVGEPPDEVLLASGAALRWRREVVLTPIPVTDDCWVAASDGLFTTATIFVGDHVTHHVGLADRW